LRKLFIFGDEWKILPILIFKTEDKIPLITSEICNILLQIQTYDVIEYLFNCFIIKAKTNIPKI